MEFQWSGHRTDRRRRVLLDELGREAGAAPAAGLSGGAAAGGQTRGPGPFYAEGASLERQPRVSHLFPTRPLAVLAFWLAGATLVMGAAALHAQLLGGPARPLLAAWGAADPGAPASAARWLGSTLWLWAAAYAAAIFLLRRHRLDDYRARYRMWLWVGAVLLAASADATIDLRQLAALAAARWGRFASPDQASLACRLALASGAAVVLVRLMVEMRRSAGALIALALACWCWAAGEAPVWAAGLPAPTASLAAAAAPLLGQWWFVFALAVYGRYVSLEAQGRLPRRRPRRRSGDRSPQRTAAQPDGPADKAAAPVDRRPAPKPASAASPPPANRRVDDASAGAPRPKLSKAERRRLRRQRRQAGR